MTTEGIGCTWLLHHFEPVLATLQQHDPMTKGGHVCVCGRTRVPRRRLVVGAETTLPSFSSPPSGSHEIHLAGGRKQNQSLLGRSLHGVVPYTLDKSATNFVTVRSIYFTVCYCLSVLLSAISLSLPLGS
jgi:hypothetical protein